MNSNRDRTGMKRFLSVPILIAAAALIPLPGYAAEARPESTVYFLAAGPRHSEAQPTPDASEYESFVVPVTDPGQIATIRSLIQRAENPVVRCELNLVTTGSTAIFTHQRHRIGTGR